MAPGASKRDSIQIKFQSHFRYSAPKDSRRRSEEVLRVAAGEARQLQVHSRDSRVARQGGAQRGRSARTKSNHEHFAERAAKLEELRLRYA